MMDPDNPGGQEQRQHSRRLFRTTAQLVVPGSAPFPVRTLDISVGGLAILATVRPPQGLNCRVLLSLSLRGQGPVAMALPVTVAHSIFAKGEEGVKVGLSFNSLEPDVAAMIQQFVGGEG